MDIGDLIFLIIMGLGFLSSIGGAARKKKKSGASRPRPQTQAEESPRTVNDPAKTPRRSRIKEARDRVKSQMDELLRELERQNQPDPLPKPLPKPAPRRDLSSSDTPEVTYLERELPDEIVVRDGTLHQQFHDRYISPLTQPVPRSTKPRAQQHLRRQSLREAVLLKEILAPPKALRAAPFDRE